MRCYLDVVKAAQDLEEVEFNQSELELPGIKQSFYGTSCGSVMCVLVSVLVAGAFIGTAMGMSAWGVSVYGAPYTNVTAVAAYVDSAPVAIPDGSNATCAVAAQEFFDFEVFFGVPAENVAWNLYAGMVLGLVFGFLDNFGLFYGMSALDPVFYSFGLRVTVGITDIAHSTPVTEELGEYAHQRLVDIHTATGDLMSGLGNTFSDLLGVALGTAALEIAKAGLNVEPTFWVLDLISIVLGCLLGCFMPMLLKHSATLGGTRAGIVELFAAVNICSLFIAVILAGVPHVVAHYISFAFLILTVVMLLVMLIAAVVYGSMKRDYVIYPLSDKVTSEPPNTGTALGFRLPAVHAQRRV